MLLLGGTTEASLLAGRLAGLGVDAVFSYAGRTNAPVAQPLPTRIGGFGGVAGLTEYLTASGISHVIDATHPFAAQISGNAVAACALAGVSLAAFERAPWAPEPGDTWTEVPDVAAAVAALPVAPTRVFLAIGKQHLAAFATRQEHFYLLRLIDPPAVPPPFDRFAAVVGRGPFTRAADIALLREHGVTHVVAKNSGGSGARAKLDAARALGLPVILIARPAVPARRVLRNVDAVVAWLEVDPVHPARAERGV